MRLILAEDVALLRQSMAVALTGAGFTVIGEAASADALVAMVDADRPDVAVIDVRMPPTYTSEGVRAALDIRAGQPRVGVLVLSQYVETVYALQLLEQSGAGVG